MERRHILVVEDEQPTLTLLEKILTAAGYRVTGVMDGIAALNAARCDPPDLVLLDLIIPGGSTGTESAPCSSGTSPSMPRSSSSPAVPTKRTSKRRSTPVRMHT